MAKKPNLISSSVRLPKAWSDALRKHGKAQSPQQSREYLIHKMVAAQIDEYLPKLKGSK